MPWLGRTLESDHKVLVPGPSTPGERERIHFPWHLASILNSASGAMSQNGCFLLDSIPSLPSETTGNLNRVDSKQHDVNIGKNKHMNLRILSF